MTALRRYAGPASSVAVGGLWILLDLWRPNSNFHFAPLLVAAAWGYGHRWFAGEPSLPGAGLVVAAGGLVLVIAVVVVISAGGGPGGTTFWGSGSDTAVAAENVVAGLLGAAWGFRVVTRGHDGALLGSEDRNR